MRVAPWLLAFLPAAAAMAMAGRVATETPAAPLISRAPAPSPAAACPLTRAEEKKAVLAFEEMMPVVRHPRCNNCHGGIDPLVPYAQGGHMGNLDTSTIAHNSVQTRRRVCQECHSELEGWDTPGDPMLWAGKTTKQICMQFKEFSDDPADFIGHITNEHGGVQFIETAFKGERALNDMGKDIPGDDYGKPFRVEPPPGTQQELIRHATEWANAVGPRGWTATKECGCATRVSAYVGTVTTTYQMENETLGRFKETAISTAFFETDSSFNQGTPQDYWKSSGGTIQWTSTATGGACTGSYSGTTPIGIGGDENPMGILSFDPERSPPVFGVAIGPWKEQYYVVSAFRCKEGPPLTMPLPFGAGMWWGHDPKGMELVGDGSVLSGAYSTQLGPATASWTWSFHRTGGKRPAP